MEDHDQVVIHSSDDPNWRTPDAAFELLHDEFLFDIDAAATAEDRKVPFYFGPDHLDAELRDGLAVDWAEVGQRVLGFAPTIFINPPYSRKQYRLTHDPAMQIERWARKCWEQAQRGCTIVGIFPFSPQTDWYTTFVQGQGGQSFAAVEERRLPHRISFMRSDGSKANNAGVNSVIIVWKPRLGRVWPWVPATSYWTYRKQAEFQPTLAFNGFTAEAA